MGRDVAIKLAYGALIAATSLALAACGGGGDGGSTPKACERSSTAVSVHVDEFTFRESCLEVPAGQEITVTLENDHWESHNFTVLEPGESALGVNHRFMVIARPEETTTGTLGPFEAGTFDFVCTIHPDSMSGEFVVR